MKKYTRYFLIILLANTTLLVSNTKGTTVNHVNNPPFITNKDTIVTIAENSATKTIDLLANIGDIDGDIVTTSIVSNLQHGTININTLGEIIYTPNADFVGTETITYQVCDDATPSLSVTGTIVIVVSDSSQNNQAPVHSDVTKTEIQDQTLSFEKN